MKTFFSSIGVAAFGLVTTVLTALVVVVISKMTGFNLFTLSIWVVVPVGALLVGFAAASGYYFGSLYFHTRANWFLLLQMLAIAGFAQMLIYYVEYTTLVLDDGQRVAQFVPFLQYLDISLTSAHYRVGRGASDTGEVGSFGYWLAVFQFIGFLLGGLAVYIYLRTKAVCKSCNLYLRPLAKREKSFPNGDAVTPYYDALVQHPVDSPEFAALIRSEAQAEAKQGALSVTTTLNGCPKCKSQLIEENVRLHDGKDWKYLTDLERRIDIPDGLDLVSVFRV